MFLAIIFTKEGGTHQKSGYNNLITYFLKSSFCFNFEMKITADRMEASVGPVTSILTLLSVLEPVFLLMPGGVFATESAKNSATENV